MASSKVAVIAFSLMGGGDAFLRQKEDTPIKCNTFDVIAAEASAGDTSNCGTNFLTYKSLALCANTKVAAKANAATLPEACKPHCCVATAITPASVAALCEANDQQVDNTVSTTAAGGSTGPDCGHVTGTLETSTVGVTKLLTCCKAKDNGGTDNTNIGNTATNSTTNSPAGSSCR